MNNYAYMKIYTDNVPLGLVLHVQENIPPPPLMVFHRKLNICQTNTQH